MIISDIGLTWPIFFARITLPIMIGGDIHEKNNKKKEQLDHLG